MLKKKLYNEIDLNKRNGIFDFLGFGNTDITSFTKNMEFKLNKLKT